MSPSVAVTSDIGSLSGMSQSRATSIRFAPVVAVILGVAAMLLTPVAPGLHPFALILAIAGLLVGGVSAFNNRTDRTNLIAAGVGAAVSLVALIVVLVAIAA